MKMPTEEMQVEGKSLSFLVDSRVTHSVIKCAHLPNCEPSGLWQPASGGGVEQWGPFYVLLTTHTVASHLDPFVTVQEGRLQITRRQHPPPERCLRHHRRPRGSPDTVHNNNVIFIVFIIAVQLLSPTCLTVKKQSHEIDQHDHQDNLWYQTVLTLPAILTSDL